MELFDPRSIRRLLDRNFAGIKDVFDLLGMQNDYERFVHDCEAEIRKLSVNEVTAEVDGFALGYHSGAEALHSAQRFAYILSRMAELAMSQGTFEKSMFLLNEASYCAGHAQGIGWAKYWENWRPETDSSEAARHAAKRRHQKASEPVKDEICRLLELQGRGDKWNYLASAINSIVVPLGDFLVKIGSAYKIENMATTTVPNWSKKDAAFRKKLGQFVKLPA